MENDNNYEEVIGKNDWNKKLEAKIKKIIIIIYEAKEERNGKKAKGRSWRGAKKRQMLTWTVV